MSYRKTQLQKAQEKFIKPTQQADLKIAYSCFINQIIALTRCPYVTRNISK